MHAQGEARACTSGGTTTVTHPNATQSTTLLQENATTVQTHPDGTVVTTTKKPDPRFTMVQPLADTTIVTPGGLTRTETTTRTIAGQNPNNILVFGSQTTTHTVNGRTWTSTFTQSTGLETTQTPAGRFWSTTVDAQGRPTRFFMSGILPIDLDYDDAKGRLETITQGTRVLRAGYFGTADGRNGYLASLTNPLGDGTAFQPDALGQVLSQTAPDTSRTELGWDEAGNLESVTPPGKPIHQMSYTPHEELASYDPPMLTGVPEVSTGYSYDLDHALETVIRPDGLTVTLARDTAGRLDTVSFPGGLVDYDFFPSTSCAGCAPGRIKQVAGPYGVTLSYLHDGPLTTKETWSGNISGSVSFAYNNDLQRTSETVAGAGFSKTTAFGRDTDELLTCVSPSTCSPVSADALVLTRTSENGLITRLQMAGVREDWTYNPYGELASQVITEGGIETLRFDYDTGAAPRDNLGRISQKSESTGGTTSSIEYRYDLQGRVTDAIRSGVTIEHFTYDDNGNRRSYTTPSGTTVGTYDDQDRLLTYGTLVCTYGANGELESKADTATNELTTYEYDVVGNLTRVTLPDSRVIEYEVDGRGRRVGKRVDGVLMKQWLYRNQLNPVAELDGSGNLVSQFAYGARSNVPDYVVRGASIYRIISDQLGSVRKVVNVSNPSDVLFEASYSTFGEMTVLGGSADSVPFGFAGGLYDGETGLTRFGARDYDAKVGRWTAKDPIRWAGGQRNLFLYVGNDPVNRLDPTGLRDYGCDETQHLLDDAIGEYSNENLASGLWDAAGNNSLFRQGQYDFRFLNVGDTFFVPGAGQLTPAEFGNYFAGYVNYGAFGDLGLNATRVGGSVMETGEYLTWGDADLDIELIRRGAFDFQQQYGGGGSPAERGPCACGGGG